MSTLVHSRGEGVKIGSNLVHVVVEWPQSPMSTNKVDLKPWHSLIVPSKLKGYLEDTFKEDNVKVKEVTFTYYRKEVAKIRNNLEKVERALAYCRKYPESVKLYKVYLFCGTRPETALEYYKKRGLHFKSIFSPTDQLFCLGVVHKLRLQDEVGRWSKNVHFVSTFIP